MAYIDFIKETLESACLIAKDKHGKVSGVTKPGDNNQVLTEADIAIGNYIVSAIQSKYPEHNIIDEEAGVIDNTSEYTWVIDPIDGTSNFAVGSPMYGIMFGLLRGAEPIAGGIALPEFSELFIAEKGSGAFCNEERIFVTQEKSLLSCLCVYQIDGHQEDPAKTYQEAKYLANFVLGIRNLRVSGGPFDPMMIARGKYGAYLNQTSKIWDNVAPHIIIQEAGGVYTDFYGRPIDYSNPLSKVEMNFTQCSGAPALHAQVQEIIKNTL